MKRPAQLLDEGCQEEAERHKRQPSELVSRLSDPEAVPGFQPQRHEDSAKDGREVARAVVEQDGRQEHGWKVEEEWVDLH